MESPSHDLGDLRRFIHRHLTESIVPFWFRHAIDPDGGINTCLAGDGAILSRDKWLWSQWRAVWVFSKLAGIHPDRDRCLDLAWHIYRFCDAHAWDADTGGFVLTVAHDGRVQRGAVSIYTDGFAIYGATELARVSGCDEPLALARRVADSVLERLRQPHDQIPHFPYPIPAGARVHGIPMIFALVFWELGQVSGEARYRDAALTLCDEIFTSFYRPDRDVILERIAADGGELAPPLGTAVVLGYVIEDMWFQVHIARDRGDSARIAEACRLVRRHVELGWDDEFGGVFLAVDANGAATVGWDFADTKLWWVQTEALYALLLAYEHTRAPWCREWYDRVHEYCFTHYPDRVNGEWIQKLDRRGVPIRDVVALPVKDPFHLPRALIYCVDVLDRLTSAGD